MIQGVFVFFLGYHKPTPKHQHCLIKFVQSKHYFLQRRFIRLEVKIFRVRFKHAYLNMYI